MARLTKGLGGWQPSDQASRVELENVDHVIAFPADKVDDKARSIAQNRLLWKWLTAMEKTTVEAHKGNPASDWHMLFKEQCLSIIYERDDQGYAETMQTLRDLYRHDHQMALRLRVGVLQLTSTTQASVKQFSELLTHVDRFCAENGIQLPADPGLEELAKVAR